MHPPLEFCEFGEPALDRLALGVVRPGEDGMDPEPFIKSGYRLQLEVHIGGEEARPESLSVVQNDHHAFDRPDSEANHSPPESRGYAEDVLDRHELPADQHVGSAVVPGQEGHALGFARVGAEDFEVERVPVGNQHLPNLDAVPVAAHMGQALLIM